MCIHQRLRNLGSGEMRIYQCVRSRRSVATLECYGTIRQSDGGNAVFGIPRMLTGSRSHGITSKVELSNQNFGWVDVANGTALIVLYCVAIVSISYQDKTIACIVIECRKSLLSLQL